MNAIDFHKKYNGKIKIELKAPCNSKEQLSMLYTPGVADVCRQIAQYPSDFKKLTWSGKTVAIISDGTRVLGLGNIGPKAAMPVMEGKAYLFKKFADLNAVPICINSGSAQEIIDFIIRLSPSFAAINLEDIQAPKCFEIERQLSEKLDIPVMHDDQHGTAIIALAGLFNALRLVDKNISNAKIIVNGAGAAGSAIAKLLYYAGARNLYILDSKGHINKNRLNLSQYKQELLKLQANADLQADLSQAIEGADVFIGASKSNILTPDMVNSMADNPIVFALSNPQPEISPENIKKTKAKIYATGRSDLPNQINNALVFPGFFSGILKAGIKKITPELMVKASKAIAQVIPQNELNEQNIVPSIFDSRVVPAIEEAINHQ